MRWDGHYRRPMAVRRSPVREALSLALEVAGVLAGGAIMWLIVVQMQAVVWIVQEALR